MPARRVALGALALILLLLGGLIGIGTQSWNWQPAPKLALDLEGGTQVILQARSRDGEAIDDAAMEQARQIMSQRINAMGVAETEITVQGGSNIVVDVPGELDQETSNALRQTAAMSFRPVLNVMPPEGLGAADPSGEGADANEVDPADEKFRGPLNFENPYGDDPAAAPAGTDDGLPYPAWSMDWADMQMQQDLMMLDCTDPTSRQEAAQDAEPDKPIVLCDDAGTAKYLLGPEVVPGSAIQDARVANETTPTGQPTGYYVVNMTFNDTASEAFATMTQALFNQQGATDQFGIVLDGMVISAPQVREPSADGEASITGQFTYDQASTFADQLRFGALPLEFDVASEQQISATLGSDQLEKGLIAGLLGLALVIIYAFFQYRVLAVVTTASLGVMGLLAYGTMTVLSNVPEIGYRLSLAGVVGLILSIAFTADSFIVYFERVRDEIREGRGIVAAVDHGWERAKKTILASDTVNLIAALVLYLLSTGGVRGFAFTLGLTTVLDLLVVFLFTHPLLQSLVRTRFFGKGHPWSGLDPAALGRNVPAYAGRGRVRSASERGRRKSADAPQETLAQRKAREAREAAQSDSVTANDDVTSDPAPNAGDSVTDDAEADHGVDSDADWGRDSTGGSHAAPSKEAK